MCILFYVYFFVLIYLLRRSVKKAMTSEDQQLIAQLEQKILKRKAQINEIEQSLPKKNSLYLKVIFCKKFVIFPKGSKAFKESLFYEESLISKKLLSLLFKESLRIGRSLAVLLMEIKLTLRSVHAFQKILVCEKILSKDS